MSRDESHDHYTITVSAGLGWAGLAGLARLIGVVQRKLSRNMNQFSCCHEHHQHCVSALVMVCYNRVMRVTAYNYEGSSYRV